MYIFDELIREGIPEKCFLVTGGAGFIGSNIVAQLLKAGAGEVRVLDNFSTGFKENVSEFVSNNNFKLIKGDITKIKDCRNATRGVDFVLHQAALGSVPRSIKDPISTHNSNLNGFINILNASVENNVKRFVFASSSSVYGDDLSMPKQEYKTGELLSPYSVTKKANELYANVFYKTYGIETVGLRYFNVFGPKQNVLGPYAAVIPIFVNELLENRSPVIYGDGSTTRDFTYVSNVVQANIKACFTMDNLAYGEVFNIACGETTSLLEIFKEIAILLGIDLKPRFDVPRMGDIKDSWAEISKAKKHLNYLPETSVKEGLIYTVEWYKKLKRG